MEKTRSYFKHLRKAMDVVVALLVGLALAACLFVVEWKDIFFRIKPSYATWLQAIFNGAVVVAVVGSFVALIPSLKYKGIAKSDALLCALTGLSVGGAVLFGAYGNVTQMILWIVAFVACLCFFILRARHFDENVGVEDAIATKRYFATIARKYNFGVLALVVGVVGVAAVFVAMHTDLFSGLFKYAAVGGVAVACLFFCIYTLAKKDSKVNVLDALLICAFVIGAFAAFFFVNRMNLRFIAVWALFEAAIALTILVRSMFVKTTDAVEVKRKGLANYYGALFEKHSVSLPVLLGIACGFCFTFMTRYSRLSEVFVSGRKTVFLALGAIAIIVLAVALWVLGVVRKGYTNRKVNVLDVSLLLTMFAVLFGCGMLFDAVSTPRLLLVIIPGVFAIASIIFRVIRVDVVSQEATEDNEEEVSFDVKLVINGDDVKVFCDGAEINVEVIRNEKVEEVEETKVEEVTEEVKEEAVEETEDAAEEEAVEEETTEEAVEEVKEEVSKEEKLIIAKRSFENKIKFASEKAKNYYSELKNAIMVYKPKTRVSKKAEAFRKKGLFAKLSVSGKSIRVHLALDPAAYDEGRYHHLDLGSKRAFKEVPFTMKIRSDLALKRAIELIDELAAQRGLKRNKKYEVVDYSKGLDVDGAAILEKLGLLDQLSDHVTKQQAEALTDDVLAFIPTITLPRTLNEESENVYLDTALKYVEDTISAETLHGVHQIPSTVDIIRVKARTGLDKRITVVADEIEPTAAKLVLLCGGKVFKVVRK